MVCASEVYQWFKTLSAHSRIEITCGLLQLCLPNELTFIGTLIEDMSNKNFELEERCNSPSELSQYPHCPLNVEHVHKLCLTLSLLKPTNQVLAQLIYEIMTIHFSFLCQNVMVHSDFSNDIMLLFALASYHPAFTFQCRLKIGEYFATLLEIFNANHKDSSNANNSALVNDSLQVTMSVSDVFVERTDAIIVIEINSEHSVQKCVTKRQCHYSEIKEMIGTILHTDHEFYKIIIKLHSNGSFTLKNIRNIVNRILNRFSYPQSCGEEARKINDFFFHLPEFIGYEKDEAEVDCNPSHRGMTSCVFQNDKSEVDFNRNEGDNESVSLTPFIEREAIYRKGKCTKAGGSITNIQDNSVDIKRVELQPFIIQDSENEKDRSFEKKIMQCDTEKHLLEKAYFTKNIIPINMLSVPYQPYMQFYVPNYAGYSNTDCCTSSICRLQSTTSQESPFITPSAEGITSTCGTVVHQCGASNFIPYNINQSTFAPVHFLYHPVNCSFHLNDHPPSLMSHVIPSFQISNVNRSHQATMPLEKPHINQNAALHYRDSSL